MQHDISADWQKEKHGRKDKCADEENDLGHISVESRGNAAYAHERNGKQEPDNDKIRIGDEKRYDHAGGHEDDFVYVLFHEGNYTAPLIAPPYAPLTYAPERDICKPMTNVMFTPRISED